MITRDPRPDQSISATRKVKPQIGCLDIFHIPIRIFCAGYCHCPSVPFVTLHGLNGCCNRYLLSLHALSARACPALALHILDRKVDDANPLFVSYRDEIVSIPSTTLELEDVLAPVIAESGERHPVAGNRPDGNRSMEYPTRRISLMASTEHESG